MEPRDSHDLLNYLLQARAADQGRVNQQGSGIQLNIEQLLLTAALSGGNPTWREESRPLVSEVDPLIELGVHRAPVEHGSPLTPYVERDRDAEVRSAISAAAETGGFVLLVGESTAGKTRSAYEAVAMLLPSYRIWNPDTGGDLAAAVSGLLGAASPGLLWLDDLERYLGEDALTANILRQLRQKRTVILATMRSEFYGRYAAPARGSNDAPGHIHGLGNTARLIEQATVVVLDRRWHHAEVERARTLTDSRIRAAVEKADLYGVAEYLAAGPDLYREWQLARSSPDSNPRGAALVAAAVDVARLGITEPLDREWLATAHEVYLNREGGELLRPESLDDALSWALRRRRGVTSLLTPRGSNGTVQAFDYLPETYTRDEPESVIPEATWGAVLVLASGNRARLHALAAASEKFSRLDVAENCYRQLLDLGEDKAIHPLTRCLLRGRRYDEAHELLDDAFGKGDLEAGVALGEVLISRGRQREGREVLRSSANQGNTHAAFHLANELQSQGRFSEAEQWYQRVAEEDESNGAFASFVLALRDLDREEFAEASLREAAAEGDLNAKRILARFLNVVGEDDESETIWRELAAGGDEFALIKMGDLHQERGEFEAAESYYVGAIERGTREAYENLGDLYEAQGKNAEAEAAYNMGYELGDRDCAFRVGESLVAQGELEKALAAFMTATAGGSPRAYAVMAGKLRDIGRKEDAAVWLQRGAEAGDALAAFMLGEELLHSGDLDGAERWLTLALEEPDPVVLCDYGLLLVERGRGGEALDYYSRAFSAGHAHAGCLLGSELVKQGRLEEAEKAYRGALARGHEHAAQMLPHVLARLGRGAEAAAMLRESQGSHAEGRGHGRGRKASRSKKRGSGRRRRK